MISKTLDIIWKTLKRIKIMSEKKEQVSIDGVMYDIDNPDIVIDYFTGNYILRNDVNLYAAYRRIRLSNQGALSAVLEEVYTIASATDLLEDGDMYKLFYSVSNGTFYYLTSNYEIEGQGSLRSHPNARDRRLGYLYDFPTFQRLAADPAVARVAENKFRPFNNQVSAFKDFDNEHLNASDKLKLRQRNYAFGVDSATYKMFEGLQYTLGVELETSAGRITEEEAVGLNLKCEFDGSLRDTPDQRREDVMGGEYITGVLKGDSGMFHLQRICNKLSEKCTINEKCGVHVHVGSIAKNKENVVYLYKLGELIQDEVYEMLPTSRRKNVYCRKIKPLGIDLGALNNVVTPIGRKILIDEFYNKIFREVSHSKHEPDRSTNKCSNHPMGSKCGYDKATQRYCWLNFVTLLFNTKGNPNAMTLEFRNHSATLNYKKIKNWVRICVAIVAFAENHKASIKRGYWLDANKNEHNINLSTIVKAIYPKTYKTLENYIADRKNKFFYDKGDIEKQEYATDKDGVNFLTLKEDVKCV